jgi:hypothetical protein
MTIVNEFDAFLLKGLACAGTVFGTYYLLSYHYNIAQFIIAAIILYCIHYVGVFYFKKGCGLDRE